MRRLNRNRLVALAAVIGVSALAFAGCTQDQGNGQEQANKIKQENYDALIAKQLPHKMAYSPSINTINAWIDDWGKEPGKLAYVYLRNMNGDVIGYYIFNGPPITNCAALTPTYKLIKSDNGNISVPAPGMDGVYYSGGQCGLYYGIDAVSKTTIAFTVDAAQSMTYFGQPLPVDAPPLGVATLEKVK